MYTLTGQPKSTQAIYRYTCAGKFPRMYMTQRGKDLKEHYQWELKSQRPKLLVGDLKVKLDLFFKDKKKRDVDNFNKLILDAGSGILYADDSQIQRLTVTKNYDKNNPRIVISIMKYDGRNETG